MADMVYGHNCGSRGHPALDAGSRAAAAAATAPGVPLDVPSRTAAHEAPEWSLQFGYCPNRIPGTYIHIYVYRYMNMYIYIYTFTCVFI